MSRTETTPVGRADNGARPLTPRATVALTAAGASLIAACYGLARFAYGLFLPAFREAFALDAATAGLIASGRNGRARVALLQQELQLVDPAVWTPVLQEWFGVGVASIPFAVTSFGHVYHLDEDGRVQCLDPHFLTNLVVAESADEFFAEHLVGPSSHLADLRGPHQGARTKLGLLGEGELYSFTPMLPLGGTVSPEALTKGDGVQHALLTHRMVREQRQR